MNTSPKHRLHQHNWYVKNREHARQTNKQWQTENPDNLRAISARWCTAHPGKSAANTRKHQLARATPPWVNPDDLVPFYAMAERLTKETGVEHHVDHIVPIKGENVCGLHVPWNLCVMTGADNRRKGNRLC